jgi:hypothetical protein
MRLLLVLPLLLLAACGASGSSDALPPSRPGSSPGADSPAAGGDISRADNDLAVEYDPGNGSGTVQWTLTCVGSVDGNHPEGEKACEHLKGMEEPFAPLPADSICTQQYGGPQTARVTGVWRGEPVDLTLSRTDGCLVSQWDSLVPLVPAAS